jgi:hypothetical protein
MRGLVSLAALFKSAESRLLVVFRLRHNCPLLLHGLFCGSDLGLTFGDCFGDPLLFAGRVL